MRGFLYVLALALLPTVIFLIRQWIMGRIRKRRIRPRQADTGAGRLQVQPSGDGTFRVRALINDASVDLVIDTGADTTVLNLPAAHRAGLDPDSLHYDLAINTANGRAENAAAEVTLRQVEIGPLRVSGLPALVSRAPLDENLLGLDFLKSLRSFEIRDGVLHMEQ